ncbi:MAG: prepilin-type N-terminal cleavage/methylation domain-containing protein [FCB group bacterium]|nr:prepilin-type N-terminal cleavage/methylation domain-containing protein [FCB group bacterium]
MKGSISMRICSEQIRRESCSCIHAFTLLELTITVTIFSILVGAVYLLFLNQRNVADENIEHNIIETEMRLALDEIEEYVQNAGLTAYDVGNDWHPILYADSSTITFVADIDERGSSGREDILTLSRDELNLLLVTDATGRIVYQGSVRGRMTFAYFDSGGEKIPSSKLDTAGSFDRIRQIEFAIEVEIGDGAIQSRTCTPPNLSLAVL